MASNGLSSRRSVLKRPPVCKSTPTGDCGACEYTIASPQQLAPPNTVCEFQIALTCDPLPAEKEFSLFMAGAWTPVEPAPVLTVGTVALWHARSPATSGNYTVKIDATNADKCRHFGSINMIVS